MTAPLESTQPCGYRIGDLLLDLARRCVWRGDREIRVGKLSYKVLVALAEAAPNVVTRERLAERVWDGRYVNPATIKQRIVLLRKALGDSAERPAYISVVRGQGYGLVPQVQPVFERHRGRRHRGAPWLIAGLAAGLALLAVLYRTAPLLGPPALRAVVVLPFENLSPDPEDAYFATGLHEEVVNQLAELDDLRVISRAAAQRDSATRPGVAAMGDALDVDAILQGTVRYADDRVRIGMQLMDPVSGALIWSQTYERDFADIFEIQRQIAASVTGALGVTLRVGGSDGFRGAGTDSIDAYEAYLHGLDSLRRPEGQSQAVALFRRATELDPSYSAPWAQWAYEIAATAWTAPPERSDAILGQAYPLAVRAAELDPMSARTASTLGTIQYALRDWVAAEASHTRAIALRTTRYTLAQHANMLLRAGRITAARSAFATADAIEPMQGNPPPLRVQVSIADGDYAAARALAAVERRAVLRDRALLNIALNEGDRGRIAVAMAAMVATQPVTGTLYGGVLERLASPEHALEIVRLIYADAGVDWAAKRHDVALLAAYLGDPELALEAAAAEARLSTTRYWLLWYPVLAPARQRPEFKTLVSELGLVDYWRAYGWADDCAPLAGQDFTCG